MFGAPRFEEPRTAVPWDCLRAVIDLCVPDLKQCILRHGLRMDDECLVEIVTLCPELSTLDVSGFAVTDDGVRTVAAT